MGDYGKTKRIGVIGAGVVGITTAHFLQQKGFDVHIFEKGAEVAGAASHANGGQLSYSFCDSMADPSLLAKLPGILLGRDPAFKIRFSRDPDFYRWGMKFLSNCTGQRRDLNSNSLLKLALRSACLMATFKDAFGKHFHMQHNGKLVLLSAPATNETKRRINAKQANGCAIELVNREQIEQIEPSLATWSKLPSYAIYSQNDEVGDARCFSKTLATQIVNKGATLHLNSDILAVNPSTTACRLSTANEQHTFDAVVVCSGDNAAGLLDPLGIKLPIYPVAGYSATFAMPDNHQTRLNCSVTALEQRMVFSPIGNQLRIAGFADMNTSRHQNAARIQQLIATAKSLAPAAADYQVTNHQPWTGYRPTTPNSLPIVGATKVPSIYTNIGHGMLGWTLSAATAEQLANSMA